MSIKERPDALLTTEQAAKRLGVKPRTLQSWRITGRYSLPFVKSGSLVRYRERDIQSFLRARTQAKTTRKLAVMP
jgi:excisionase family DNA binding protein